jgi:hypothetical protein
LDVVGDRALLAAVACFVEASSTTLAVPVFVAELMEGVNGCWIDAAVLKRSALVRQFVELCPARSRTAHTLSA